ncbi:putative virion structural protein [Salmonella phage SPFM8]|nr:putative virion structural protein [Salmonella phage SPFM8]
MARKEYHPHSTPLDIVKLVDDVDPMSKKTTEWLDLFFQALIAAELHDTIPDYALIGTNNADIARYKSLNAVVIAGPENDSRKTTEKNSGAISTPTTDVTDLPSIYDFWVKAISRFGEWTVQTITSIRGIPNEEDVAALYSPILPGVKVFPEIFTTTKFTIVPGWRIKQALRDYILANSSFTVALSTLPIPMSAIIYGRAGRNPSYPYTSLITNIYTWHDQEDFDAMEGFNLPDHHNKINELADGVQMPILPVDTFLAVKSVVEKIILWFADEDFNQDYTGFEIESWKLETTADKVEDPSDVNNQSGVQSGAMIQTNSNWFPRWVLRNDEVEFQRLLLGQFNSVIFSDHVLTVSQWIYQQSILGNVELVAFTSKRDELPIKTPAVSELSYSFAKSKQYFTKENLQIQIAALIDNGPGNTAPVGELN